MDQVGPGDTLLVHAAAGGVGTVAVQTAVILGVPAIGTQRSAERLTRLTGWYTEGGLRIEISRTFPLERAADAHRAVETGHVRGKVAIVVP